MIVNILNIVIEYPINLLRLIRHDINNNNNPIQLIELYIHKYLIYNCILFLFLILYI